MAAGKGKRIGWALGAAALGIGAGLTAERLMVGRERLRADPFEGTDYGRIRADRSYEVAASDGATLVVGETGAEGASDGAVFLHGFCLDHTVWHHQMDAFDPSRRYVFYDARGHGRSEPKALEDGSITAATLAGDLGAVLERSGLRRAVIVGHSMGGMTSLEFCRANQEMLGGRIAGLVLVNTTYTDALRTVVGAEVVGALDRRVGRVVQALLRDRRSSRVFRLRGDDLSWVLVRMFGFGKDASPTQVEYVRRLLAQFPSPPLIEILKGLRNFDMSDALDSISVPTLIIAGGEDRITTVGASERMAQDIPDARLEVMDATGHMTMMERHDRFNGSVEGLLDEVLPAAGRRKAAR